MLYAFLPSLLQCCWVLLSLSSACLVVLCLMQLTLSEDLDFCSLFYPVHICTALWDSLTYVLSTAMLDAMGHRWIAGLANYNFHIHYKSGKSNVEADALSRIDWEKCDETVQGNSIQAIVVAAMLMI